MTGRSSDLRSDSLLDPSASAAVEWMILLRSGTANAEDIEAFKSWRDASPLNETACKRIEKTLGHFETLTESGLPEKAVHSSLMAPIRRRSAVRTLLSLAIAGIGTAILLPQSSIYRRSTADFRTATGLRQSSRLPDGTSIILNAKTAVNMISGSSGLSLELLGGELLLQRQLPLSQDLLISTAEGQFIASSGTFSLRQNDGSTRVNVVEGELRVMSSAGSALAPIKAGQSADVSFGGSRIVPQLSPYAETAWIDGKLQVNNRRLEDVVAALSDYWHGFIQLSPQAAKLRISGIFPLDDVPFALDALAQSMPIKVKKIGSLWTSIDIA
ncbi:FecR family protein [Pseudomonas sp. S31]|nr:FecR family protein [Pseudomonas sp. S31]